MKGTNTVKIYVLIHLKNESRTSLVVQSLGILREDPTCYRATKPMHHNY